MTFTLKEAIQAKKLKLIATELEPLARKDRTVKKIVDTLKKGKEPNPSDITSLKGNTQDEVVMAFASVLGPSQTTKFLGEEKKTIKVGEDAVGAEKPHYVIVKDRKVIAKGNKEEMMEKCGDGERVWLSTKDVGDVVEGKEDPDIGDRKGSQPAVYHKGLSKSTKEKRDAQFKKQAKMDDDNPAAYKPAPGDKEAKTKESKYTKKYKEMFGESATNTALQKKSEDSGIAYGILKSVYDRGVAAWRTGHRPGTTPAQWGMARVNSFITGGKTRTTADKDLWQKHKGKNEEVDMSDKELFEAVRVDDSRYKRSHKEAPKGKGLWGFTTKPMGKPKESEMYMPALSMDYKQAVEMGKKWADRQGSSVVYVLESTEVNEAKIERIERGDKVRIKSNPKNVADKTMFGKSGVVMGLLGRDLRVKFANGRSLMVDPKDVDLISEANKEDMEPASPDEKSMALKQADFIQYVGREIGEHLVADKEFPEWMQNKLSALHQKAKDMHATLGAHGGDEMEESFELDESVTAKIYDAAMFLKRVLGFESKYEERLRLKRAGAKKLEKGDIEGFVKDAEPFLNFIKDGKARYYKGLLRKLKMKAQSFNKLEGEDKMFAAMDAVDQMIQIRNYISKNKTQMKESVELEEARKMSAAGHVWRARMDYPFVVRATVGRVSNELVGSYKTFKDAIKAAEKEKDAVVWHSMSGRLLYSKGKKTKDARMYESVELSEAGAKLKDGDSFDHSIVVNDVKVTLARRGKGMSVPYVVYLDGKEWKTFSNRKTALKAGEEHALTKDGTFKVKFTDAKALNRWMMKNRVYKYVSIDKKNHVLELPMSAKSKAQPKNNDEIVSIEEATGQKLFMFDNKKDAQAKAKEIRGKMMELGPKNFAVITKDLTVVREEDELDEMKVRGQEAFDKTFANRTQAENFAKKNGGTVRQVGRVFYVFKEEVNMSNYNYRTEAHNPMLVSKAIRVAEQMGGDMTGAVEKIEKMSKGLSDHPKVKAALRMANEDVDFDERKLELLGEISKGLAKRAFIARAKRVEADRQRQDRAGKLMQKRKERRGTSGGGSDDFFKAKGIASDAYDRKQKGERKLERSHRKMGGSNDAAYNIRQKATRSQRYQEYRREGGKLSMQDWMKYQKESYEIENISDLIEKAESQAQAIAARIALRHKREGTQPKPGTASAEMMKMSEKDLEDFTKAKKGAPEKVEEAFRKGDKVKVKSSGKTGTIRTVGTGKKKGNYVVDVGNQTMSFEDDELIRESVELNENFRTLARHGMGTEPRSSRTKTGLELDYYDKDGSKRSGKIIKTTDKGYVVKDDRDGKTHSFSFLDRAKARELLAKHGKGQYNEEMDLMESHFKVGDKVTCIESGMKGEVIKLDEPQVGKYYTVRREDGKVMKYASDELKKVMSEAMDPVDKDALKQKFKKRKDKDIDNDGDVDSSDEYLHKRRSAISKAIAKEESDTKLKEKDVDLDGDTDDLDKSLKKRQQKAVELE